MSTEQVESEIKSDVVVEQTQPAKEDFEIQTVEKIPVAEKKKKVPTEKQKEALARGREKLKSVLAEKKLAASKALEKITDSEAVAEVAEFQTTEAPTETTQETKQKTRRLAVKTPVVKESAVPAKLSRSETLRQFQLANQRNKFM